MAWLVLEPTGSCGSHWLTRGSGAKRQRKNSPRLRGKFFSGLAKPRSCQPGVEKGHGDFFKALYRPAGSPDPAGRARGNTGSLRAGVDGNVRSWVYSVPRTARQVESRAVLGELAARGHFQPACGLRVPQARCPPAERLETFSRFLSRRTAHRGSGYWALLFEKECFFKFLLCFSGQQGVPGAGRAAVDAGFSFCGKQDIKHR